MGQNRSVTISQTGGELRIDVPYPNFLKNLFLFTALITIPLMLVNGLLVWLETQAEQPDFVSTLTDFGFSIAQFLIFLHAFRLASQNSFTLQARREQLVLSVGPLRVFGLPINKWPMRREFDPKNTESWFLKREWPLKNWRCLYMRMANGRRRRLLLIPLSQAEACQQAVTNYYKQPPQ